MMHDKADYHVMKHIKKLRKDIFKGPDGYYRIQFESESGGVKFVEELEYKNFWKS